MAILLIILACLLAYAWLGYPLALRLLGRRPAPPPAEIARPAPPVSVLFSAYNEQDHIQARIENLLAATAAHGDVQIHVGVDGVGDNTGVLAMRVAQRAPSVHVHVFPVRRGKVAVLKDLVRESAAWRADAAASAKSASPAVGEADRVGEILVFTDANTRFEADALAKLLRHFGDPLVGGVCGRLVFPEGRQESVYWRWETRLKEAESRLDSCLGANGAIYAIRRELFWQEIPDTTIVDDFVIGMKVREKGGRMIYDPEAVAEEDLPETADEWSRRVRIGSGDYQSLRFCCRCLGPRYGWFAWSFWSHKVLRWFTPHLGLLAVVVALVSVVGRGVRGRPVGWVSPVVLGLSVLSLVCFATGRRLRGSSAGGARFFRLCDHFLTMQAALLMGFVRFCRGGLKGHWDRTPR